MKPYSFILVSEDLKDKNIEKYFNFLLECSENGISAIQIRNKTRCFDRFLTLQIQKLATKAFENNVHVFINDNYKISKQLPYQNVHLGQDDASPFVAKQNLNENALIGYSVNNLSQLKKANTMSFLNYIGLGAIFKTDSKNTENIWGLEGLKQAKKESKHKIVAIGGISEENSEKVLKNGADGLAIISDIHKAKDPFKKIQNIANIIKETQSS